MRQCRTRKPQNPLIRKNSDRVPRPNAVAQLSGFKVDIQTTE